MAKKLLATLILGAVLAGCGAGEQGARKGDDGEIYGTTEGVFRGRWWSYAERGSSYLAGKFYEDAKIDFAKAIQGRAADSWRARTYGLHFVEYFPNRELGIVEFNLGNLEAAEAALKASLEAVDTERAHYYLDLVRREQIARGVVNDATEPELSMVIASAPAVATPRPETPAPEAPAPAPPTTIIGTRELTFEVDTKDDVGVAEVTVNEEKVYQRGATQANEVLAAKKEVVLDEGTHTIQVASKDLADKEVKKEVEVTVDLTGPTIGVFSPIEPTVTPNGTVSLEGATVDKNGVVSVAVDQSLLAESPGAKKLPFNREMPLAAGENTFILAARDVAGNETRSAVKVFQGDPNSTEARLWLMKQKHPELLQYASAAGLPLLDLTFAVDEPAAAEGEIRLKSPKPDQPYRHNRTLRVSGEVVTQTKVTSLSINGQPIDELTGAPKESFNRRLPIDTNADGGSKVAVNIEATDETGKTYSQTFDVDVRPVELSSNESRMPVAVLAFAGANIDTSVTDYLRLTTEAQVLGEGRFRVVDRTRLQDVLTEQQLSAALADPNQALQLGKLTNAYVFLVADVFPHDQAGLEIKARVIDAETSDLVATLDAFVDNKDDAAKVAEACRGLAIQLAGRYPRLSGEVMSVRPKDTGAEVLINWTQEDELQQGAYFLFIQESEPWVDETTGEVLEPGEFVPVGRGRILSFLGSGVKAQQIITGEEGAPLEQGMPAITM